MTEAAPTLLTGRVIAVTGGAGGIARGIAEAVLEAQGCVALLDLAAGAVEKAARALDPGGKRLIGLAADVTDRAQLDRAFAEVAARLGGLHGLVNNAGVIRMAPAEAIEPAALDLEFAVNVKGVLMASQAAVRHFSHGGAIVNIASNAGKVGYPNMAGYNASKAAVISLTRSLSLEWAARNINVNAVCPGGVATDMLKGVADFIAGGDPAEARALMQNMVPRQLGRHIRPIEVGRVVAFLLSDAASIIRGQAISIDGGDTPF